MHVAADPHRLPTPQPQRPSPSFVLHHISSPGGVPAAGTYPHPVACPWPALGEGRAEPVTGTRRRVSARPGEPPPPPPAHERAKEPNKLLLAPRRCAPPSPRLGPSTHGSTGSHGSTGVRTGAPVSGSAWEHCFPCPRQPMLLEFRISNTPSTGSRVHERTRHRGTALLHLEALYTRTSLTREDTTARYSASRVRVLSLLRPL